MKGLAFRLYLFDLDDTLINTRESVKLACQSTLQVLAQGLGEAENNWEAKLKELIANYGSTHAAEYWRAFVFEVVGSTPTSEILAKQLFQHYDLQYWQRLKLEKGVVELLNYLQTEKIAIGLVSNGLHDFQMRKLQHTRLNHYFPVSVIEISQNYPTAQQKPAPDMILSVLNKHQIPASETVFIGNASVDIIAGNMAEVTTVAIGAISNPQNLKLLTPKYQFSSMEEFWNAIKHEFNIR